MEIARHEGIFGVCYDRRVRHDALGRPCPDDLAHLHHPRPDGSRVVRAGRRGAKGEGRALVPAAAVVLLRNRGILHLRKVPKA